LAENAGVTDLYKAYTDLVELVNPKDGEPPEGFRTLAEMLVPAPRDQSQLEVAIGALRKQQDDLDGLTEALDALEGALQSEDWEGFFTLTTFDITKFDTLDEVKDEVENQRWSDEDADIRLVFTGLMEWSAEIANKLLALIVPEGVSKVLFDSRTTDDEVATFIEEGISQLFEEEDVVGATDEVLAEEAVS
jgi:hypothetical protein